MDGIGSARKSGKNEIEVSLHPFTLDRNVQHSSVLSNFLFHTG